MTLEVEEITICRGCYHPAHCGHSCVDEDCDYCSECWCEKCREKYESERDNT